MVPEHHLQQAGVVCQQSCRNKLKSQPFKFADEYYLLQDHNTLYLNSSGQYAPLEELVEQEIFKLTGTL